MGLRKTPTDPSQAALSKCDLRHIVLGQFVVSWEHEKNRRDVYERRVTWRATMSQHLANSGLYDEGLIDRRNARPLTIAFATIVTVWMLAFGLVSVSAQINAQSQHMAGIAASIAK